MRVTASHQALIGSLVLLLGACSVSPFAAGVPRDATRVAEANPVTAPMLSEPGSKFLSLCYSTQINDPQELSLIAQDYCPYQGRLETVSQDVFWNDCPLLQPSRITYLCVPGTPPEEN